jgi:hypothetical protein
MSANGPKLTCACALQNEERVLLLLKLEHWFRVFPIAHSSVVSSNLNLLMFVCRHRPLVFQAPTK